MENPRWRPLNFKSVYLSLYTRWQRNSNGHTYIFGVQLSDVCNGNDVRPNGEGTGRGKSKMAALNLKYLYLSLYTRWQRNSNDYTYVFGVQLSNGSSENAVRTNAEKPKVENPRWRPVNLKYVYLSLYIK